MITTVYLPQQDNRERFAARCDAEGCSAETLPRGTKARADAEARSRGWERFINEQGDVGHYCAQCVASKEGAA